MDAPPGSLEALLAALHTHLLECKVCMETFSSDADEDPDRRPMSLCCGHVLCGECVRLLTAAGRPLHCPFCRLPGDPTRISACWPLTDLQELLQEHEGPMAPGSPLPPGGVEGQDGAGELGRRTALDQGTLQLVRAFGGWGTLVNPTGLALFRSGALAVVHDGKARVVVFGPRGRRLHSFGQRREAAGAAWTGLTHPLGVAVLPGGQVAVTDAGDAALKVFTSRGGPVAEARDWLRVPWGVAVSADGGVLVADEQQGALVQLRVDVTSGQIRGHTVLLEGLQNPRAVACCPCTGHIAVVEHLQGNPHTHTPQHTSKHISSPEDSHTLTHTHTHTHVMSTRLKLYSDDLTLLTQFDSLSLGLRTGSPAPPLCLTAVTFDQAGNLVAADSRAAVVWCLGRPWEDRRLTLTPLVRDGLIRPVGLAVRGDSLVVLDSGDHSVKMYSSQLHPDT
ncbi:E3 ubiquitin-protein ligase NHLRC1-like [Alosa alosa]|uniref:E3 ubiquitin-protein ligase NHLRC1-like n=1 Tax=Alosa alosa TaxID=278164 RepID=UPI0020154032|nr:E3 ubiquitin-protein ligase NHLRC1-like [Alosa alosa]